MSHYEELVFQHQGESVKAIPLPDGNYDIQLDSNSKRRLVCIIDGDERSCWLFEDGQEEELAAELGKHIEAHLG